MNNTHDRHFKQLMQERSFFEPFLKTYLPQDILKRIDWDSVDFYKMGGRHREQNTQREFEADIIYLALIGGKQSFLWIHSEHQSTADPYMPLRVTNYQIAELVSFAKQNPGKPLPTIITIIYHQGKTPWQYSLKLRDLFAEPKLAMRYLSRPILVDLPATSDEELAAHQNIGPAELIMKYIRQKDFGKRLRFLVSGIHTVDDKSRRTVLEYLVKVAEISESELIAAAEGCLLKQDKELLMTVAEQLIARGMQQGIHQGMQQGMQEGIQAERITIAKSLLLKGLDKPFIAETTGLSITELSKIQKNLHH